MPRDASGTYTLPIAPFVPLTLAKSADMNTALTDIADALTDSQSRASPTPAQGDLNMNGNNITNAADIHADTVNAGIVNANGISGNEITSNDNIAAAGIVSGATLTASGAVNAATVSASGAVTAGSVTASSATVNGTLTAATVSATGQAFVGTDLIVGNNLTTGHSANIGQFLTVGGGMRLSGISPYPNNAAAVAAGHVPADVYFNTTVGALSIVL